MCMQIFVRFVFILFLWLCQLSWMPRINICIVDLSETVRSNQRKMHFVHLVEFWCVETRRWIDLCTQSRCDFPWNCWCRLHCCRKNTQTHASSSSWWSSYMHAYVQRLPVELLTIYKYVFYYLKWKSKKQKRSECKRGNETHSDAAVRHHRLVGIHCTRFYQIITGSMQPTEKKTK